MSTHSVTWFDIGSLSDIPVRGARRVEIMGDIVAVFRTASDQVFALSDKCPHNGGPLSQGIVHGDCVTCPLHNWVISLKDGEAQGADQGKARHYPIEIEDNRLKLGVSGELSARMPMKSVDAKPDVVSA